MTEFSYWIQTIAAAIGGALGWVFGATDPLFYTLLAFITADYLSGVLVAINTRTLSSAVGSKGLFSKILILAFVGLATLMDTHILGGAGVLRGAVTFFYIANEGISLIENATHLGLPIPPKFSQALATLTDHEPQESRARHRTPGMSADTLPVTPTPGGGLVPDSAWKAPDLDAIPEPTPHTTSDEN